MLQLIYTSTPVGPVDLPALCEQAVRNNSRDEITGVLAVRNGFYLQVLEGQKALVEDTFLRIITDTRHTDLQLLSRKLVTSRDFGHYAMVEITQEDSQRQLIGTVRHALTNAPENWRALFEARFGDEVASHPQ